MPKKIMGRTLKNYFKAHRRTVRVKINVLNLRKSEFIIVTQHIAKKLVEK